MRLTEQERLLLRNQYQIMSQLTPAFSQKYGKYVAILEGGFEAEYERILGETWSSDGMSSEDCILVQKLLQLYTEMWGVLETEQFSLTKTEEFRARFPGLTGKHLDYARFLTMNGYSDFKADRLNGKHSLMPQYRKMVTKRWEILERKKFDTALSEEDIKELLDWKTSNLELVNDDEG